MNQRLPVSKSEHWSAQPLMADLRKRLKRGRVLGAIAITVLVIGVAIALSGVVGSSPGLATASLTNGFSVRYPADWKRVDQVCSHFSAPLLLLTTATPPPSCGAAFPERQRLGPNGVAVWFSNYDPYPTSLPLAERLGPSPTASEGLSCTGTATPGRFLNASIRPPGLSVGAFICGPHYKAGEAAVRKVLASIGG